MPRIRMVSRISVTLCALGMICWAISCNKSAQGDDSLVSRIQNADRILLGTPERTEDVTGGERFQVKVGRIFRGGGKPNDLIRVIQTGDKSTRVRYQAKQEYLFLLKKSADPGNGWPVTGPEAFPVVKGNVEVALAGQAEPQAIPVVELAKLIDDNPLAGEQVAPRKDLAGRWFLVVSEEGADNYMWLLDIMPPSSTGGDKAKSWQAKQLASAFQASTLESVKVQDGSIRLEFNTGAGPFRFEGKMEGGKLRGSLQKVGMAISPARLVPTDETNLEKYENPRDLAGKDDFIEALKQEAAEPLREFIKRYPDNPFSLEAYPPLAHELIRKKASKAELEKLMEDYRKLAEPWGKPIQMRAYLNLGLVLIGNNYLPELALKYLDAAEAEFSDATPGYLRAQVRRERGRAMLASGKNAEGLKLLQDVHREHPFDPPTTLLIAEELERTKKPDEALALYAELAAMPMMEPQLAAMARNRGDKDFAQKSPSASAKRLWQAKHGKLDGLDAYLTKVFEERIAAIGSNPVPERKAGEGNRVVLAELFTGGGCPPCVGVDVALSALEATFKESELIAVRYHEHVPGFDPLANFMTESRFKFYGLEGTPALFFNGKRKPYAGPLELAPALYQEMRKDVEAFLPEKTKPELKMSAALKDGKINISASAGGLQEFPPRVRMALVLVESRIEYISDNGIRVHEMIARAMPAGPAGVEPDKNGKLNFDRPFDLAKFRTELNTYLSQVEQQIGQPFARKPMALKGLKLVGFLQDLENGEVLQTAIVPVTGDGDVEKAPAEKKAADKPASSSAK